ncbi:MAG: STAS domain-containing protein [Chromatiales bacterium]|jgi:anti-sigma B factor antagonist|nr:STAS domain-containing protein [Chromatiales bacterium]MDX9766800.1 STAS domain-containing protein [Ectothiorhodospiraceae bacterium]
MKHEITRQGDVTVIALGGDVDLETSPKARELLLAAVKDSRRVLVDLSGVSYIDSSGVATLVEALQTARKQRGELALAAVSESARRVFELARLDKVFTIHATVAEGLG